MTTFEDLQDRAMRVAALYDELNLAQRGRVWTRAETMMGFVGDVGDLAKLVMAAEGARSDVAGREALEHELSDCLWAVLVLARRYEVDLAAVFADTMDELETRLTP
jgi:NTP pyrophosphatase (non-canonical NTP hydrolase)